MLIISGSKWLGSSHRLQGSQMAVPAQWRPQGPAVTALSYFKWQVILTNMPTLTSSIILNVKVFCAEGTANFQHTHLLTKGTLSKKGAEGICCRSFLTQWEFCPPCKFSKNEINTVLSQAHKHHNMLCLLCWQTVPLHRKLTLLLTAAWTNKYSLGFYLNFL